MKKNNIFTPDPDIQKMLVKFRKTQSSSIHTNTQQKIWETQLQVSQTIENPYENLSDADLKDMIKIVTTNSYSEDRLQQFKWIKEAMEKREKK